jgi:16S rRNA G966 N2-methylase RsmD
MAKKKPNPAQATFDSLGSTPTMPDGYYSGDQPNPNLRRFLETHSTQFDPEVDKYSVAAFNEPITTTKATAIYNMHSYHQGKKPHDAIRQYIRHYTKPGDIVMDPFSGSGGTALAALLENRKAIAIDRSPAATFITKNHCTPVDPTALRRAFAALEQKVSAEINWLYATKCDRCGGDATTGFTVYSQVFQCTRCSAKVPLFDCQEEESTTLAGKPKTIAVCPHCLAKGFKEEISTRGEKFGAVPVLVSYICQGGCRPARSQRSHNDGDPKKRRFFAEYDLAKIKEIEANPIPYRVPEGYSMTGFSRYKRDALNYYGVTEVKDLFTKRNLRAVATLLHWADRVSDNQTIKDLGRLAVTGCILHLSRMSHHKEGGGGITVGTYRLPQMCKERNALTNFAGKLEEICKAVEAGIDSICTPMCISTQSSCRLAEIPSDSVDYIFTDPPYSHTVQYGELNYTWEAWLSLDTSWHQEEIIVNDVRDKSEAEWADSMKRVMAECYRVLKPGRWLTLCFHDEEGTWELVQDFMAEVGFLVDKTDSVLFIDTGQKSYNQLTADKARKRDLVLNFRKPKVGEWLVTQVFIPANVDIPTFNELAGKVIRDYLTAHPGATKDHVYDAVVSRMVRRGQMEAHSFEALLRSVAEEANVSIKKNLFENRDPDLFGSHVESRWYLKETADQVDKAEQAKEDAAATRLKKFITRYLGEHREEEGIHSTYLREEFLSIPRSDWPRRDVFDWLPEYFVKTPSNTWRLPSEEEGQQLAKLREAGTLRRIKRFANALIDGVPARDKDRPGSDVDLLDWLRQCRRAGLYEQGRAIYEKGGLNLTNLDDEQQIDAEDNYRSCVKHGSEEEAKPKRKSRKKQDDDE